MIIRTINGDNDTDTYHDDNNNTDPDIANTGNNDNSNKNPFHNDKPTI